MNQLTFIEYMNQFIDLESFCVFFISLIIGLAIFSIASFFGMRYGRNLERAYKKRKQGQELTKKEMQILSDFDKYMNI